MILALDSETSGLDAFHGARPYLVTTCDSEGSQWWCEWEVDPLTREVRVDEKDVKVLKQLVRKANRFVFHNSKFDIRMLEMVGVSIPWEKVHDTHAAAHVLASMEQKNLTYLVRKYLRADISDHEAVLDQVTNSARQLVRSSRDRVRLSKSTKWKGFTAEELGPTVNDMAKWVIAADDLEDMPSSKGVGIWRADMWLPKLVATKYPELLEDEEQVALWKGVTAEYANVDSSSTMALWGVMEGLLKERGHYHHYEARMRSMPVAYGMEKKGVTVNMEVAKRIGDEFRSESAYLGAVATGIAQSYGVNLELPKGGRSGALNSFVFETLALKPVKYTAPSKTFPQGQPSFDADAKELFELELPKGKRPRLFIESMNRKSGYDTAISFLNGYERYWLPVDGVQGRARLYPSINPCGTKTCQWSSSHPNGQNISEQSESNLRRMFCPLPGRVLVSMDAKNIQLRVPTYEADEKELRDVFDHPERGPYFGSYHLFIFDVLHPELFAKYGDKVKDSDNPCYQFYKAVKNGNFARQFGAQQRKVDATFGVPGAYKKIGKRFPRIDALSKHYIQMAETYGYVETMQGYPLQCKRNHWERVCPTVPFCYHVAGTAQCWLSEAMVRCETQLREWRDQGWDGWMILPIHDEILYDFPNDDPDGNLVKIKRLKGLMEEVGDSINVPTPVSAELHPESWAKGISV